MKAWLFPGVVVALFILAGAAGILLATDGTMRITLALLTSVFAGTVFLARTDAYPMIYPAIAGVPSAVMTWDVSPVCASVMGGLLCLLVSEQHPTGSTAILWILFCPFLVPCAIIAVCIPMTRHVPVPLGVAVICLAAGVTTLAGYEYTVAKRWAGDGP